MLQRLLLPLLLLLLHQPLGLRSNNLHDQLINGLICDVKVHKCFGSDPICFGRPRKKMSEFHATFFWQGGNKWWGRGRKSPFFAPNPF
jgi:hypothetical protein